MYRISQNVVHGFRQNLLDRFGVFDFDFDFGRDYFFSGPSPLRDKAKNDIVLYSMIFQKCIRPDMFSRIRHYVAEVCALSSALPVFCLFS